MDTVDSSCSNRDETYVCPNCNMLFYNYSAFNHHLEDQCSSLKDNACSILYKRGSMHSDDQKKIVLTADEFFYGEYKPKKQRSKGDKIIKRLTCQNCDKVLRNNLRFMSHVRHKLQSEWKENDNINDFNICSHCYRHFESPFHLQCHLETVHTLTPAPTCCRICDLNFPSDEQFLEHMKENHKNNEMPYVCKECSYRTSFYQDFTKHFREVHNNGKLLVCFFCLAIHRTANSHLGHVIQHLKKSKRCPNCRLQFLTNDAKLSHLSEHHNTVLIPTKKLPRNLDDYTIYIKVSTYSSPKKVKKIDINQKISSNKFSHRSYNIVVAASRDIQGLKHKCYECGFLMTLAKQFKEHFQTEYQCLHCTYKTHCCNTLHKHTLRFHAQTIKKRKPASRSLSPTLNGLKRKNCGIVEHSVSNVNSERDKPEMIDTTAVPMNLDDHKRIKRKNIMDKLNEKDEDYVPDPQDEDYVPDPQDEDYVPDPQDEREFSMWSTSTTNVKRRKTSKNSRNILFLSPQVPFLPKTPAENKEQRSDIQLRLTPNSVKADQLTLSSTMIKPPIFINNDVSIVENKTDLSDNDRNNRSGYLKAIDGKDNIPTIIEILANKTMFPIKSGSYPLDFITNNLGKLIQHINPRDILIDRIDPPSKLWFTDVTCSGMNVNWLPPENYNFAHFQLVFCGQGIPTIQILPPGQLSVRLIALTSNTLYRVHLCCFKPNERSSFINSDQRTLPRHHKNNMKPVDDVIIIDDDSPNTVSPVSIKQPGDKRIGYNKTIPDNILAATEIVPVFDTSVPMLNPN